MLTTSITLHRKSKDGTSVTILSTSVQYQVSASPTDIPKTWYDDIKNAIQTDSKPYLWSKTTVEYSGNKTTITYSVSYKGKDGTNGTSFTPKGTATGFFYNMSSVPSYEDGMDSDVYIVNVDDRSNPTSELPPYVCHFEYENLIIEHAEFGDGYNVKGHLYVANSNEWVDFGEIQGAKGDPGDPGKDAVNINLSPSELVYNADKDGNISSTQFNNNTSTVSATMGGKAVSCSTSIVSKDNCEASFISSNVIKITKITTESVATGKYVPASAGGVKLKVTVDGTDYYSYLPFRVNINTFVKTVLETDESFQRKYTEISNKYNTISNELNGKASKDELREVSSSIEQTARRISLEVSSNAVGRRNMLVNSAFRNQDSVFIHSLARIEKNTGVDGVNCIHSSDKYSGTGDGNYIGAFWDSTQKNGAVTNIPIRMGKKYVISCWIKSDNKALPFVIECFFMNSINQQNRPEDVVRKEEHVDNVNEWKRIDFVVDTTDTSEYASKVTPYLAVNIWSNTKNVPKATGATEYPTCNAYICKPMMEEGDTYGGWTLSEDDYEYVGGNILDNTRSLEKSGNLEKEESEIINEGYEYAYAVAHSNNTTSTQIEMLQWNVAGRINDGQDYMFSFLAKGRGNINVYLYGDSVHTNVYTETCEGNENFVSTDGYAQLALTSTYKRYWVHWRIEDYTGEGAEVIPDKVLIRVPGDTEAWVTKPKLEEGAQLTDYTERKTDLIDRATAKAAGLEITSSGVTLYGEKIKVENTLSTGQTTTAALFKDGAINAALILAQMLTSQGHNGQMVRIADGLINIYGKAGTANIRFGLNSSGQAVLSYYDDNGNFLYDLGPAGIASLSKTDAKITSAQYIKAEDAGLTTPLGENVDLPWVDTTKSWYTATKDNNYILFVKGATGKTTTLYRYSAPRVNGKIVADSANGLGTYDLASAADGRTFTSRTMVKNGALTNLADGVFLTGDATVYDNTKLVPAIKKGQFVTRPSFYVQIASFNARFTTLGIFERIYSIQTETTFGNLDTGIISNNNY